MAETARTTRHYVSDSLAERYPYDASSGFAGARQRNAGVVFDGYGALGATSLVNSLTDASVSAEDKAKAAHHLYSRSASPEAKIDMLQQGIVPVLAATLNSATNVLLRHQCLLLLRSLAVLPQGCYALVFQGAIPPVLKALRSEEVSTTEGGPEVSEEVGKCQVAAAHVIHQVSENASGLRWLLGLPHETAVAGLEADNSVEPLLPEEFMCEVADALGVTERRGDAVAVATTTAVASHLLQSLARLTSLPRGVEAFLSSSKGLATVAAHVRDLASPSSAPEADQAVGEGALEVIWNVALDPAGEAALEAAEIPGLLFSVFAAVRVNVATSAVPLQRQLTGALSAVHQFTSVKLAAATPLSVSDASLTRIDALVQYLRRWNAVIEAQYASAGKPAPSGIAAIEKNTVQCIRLASEVKAVRDATHAIIAELEHTNPSEAFYLRRQLYFCTKWEAEYKASVDM